MAPRRQKDKHLPPRVYLKCGSYYFVDKNNKWHKLAKTLPEAMAKWAELVDPNQPIYKMNQLFDRYMLEVAPTKAKESYRDNIREMKNLRIAFGEMAPDAIEPMHIYKYLDIRGKVAKTRANREKSLLSHVFSMAIRWGIVRDNPCRNVKRLKETKRDRYITDQEFLTVRNIAPEFIQQLMDLAYITGLRKGDLLDIKYSDIKEDGIYVTVNKTGKNHCIEWSETLKACIEQIKQSQTAQSSTFLFSTRSGEAYTVSGFDSIWQRFMRKAVKQGVIKERFRFHDIRRKAATDAEKAGGREFARQLLGHTHQTTTAIYISGVEKVKPLK